MFDIVDSARFTNVVLPVPPAPVTTKGLDWLCPRIHIEAVMGLLVLSVIAFSVNAQVMQGTKDNFLYVF